jgi:hypothetical protein
MSSKKRKLLTLTVKSITDESIIESVRSLFAEESLESTSISSDEEEEVDELMSFSEASELINKLETHVMGNISNQDTNSDCLMKLSAVKNSILKAHNASSSQSKIANFFKS